MYVCMYIDNVALSWLPKSWNGFHLFFSIFSIQPSNLFIAFLTIMTDMYVFSSQLAKYLKCLSTLTSYYLHTYLLLCIVFLPI